MTTTPHVKTAARVRRLSVLWLLGVAVPVAAQKPGSLPHEFDLRSLVGDGARFSDVGPLGPSAIGLEPGGRGLRLPGALAEVPWSKARYLVGDAMHRGQRSGALRIEFLLGDRPRIHAKIGLLPGLPTRVVLPLHHLDAQTFFLERQPRQLKGVMPGSRLSPEQIGGVTISVPRSGESSSLWLANLRLTAERPEPLPPAGMPVVDALGQWSTRQWPGKNRSVETMTAELRALHENVKGAKFEAGDSRTRYGGWAAKRFEATGYFRVESDDGRWWLVDPDGGAFFSVGVDCVGPSSGGPVDGMRDLFAWLPEPDGPFGAAMFGRRGRREVSFLTVNLIRAFGSDWRARWEELTAGLMRDWGFNTVGNWSDRGFAERAEMPWVLPLGGFPTTSTRLYRDFPDVFADDYAVASKKFATQMGRYRDDRYLIGYFLRNEPLWAFGENNLAAEMLATGTPSATRQALVKWLNERYAGDVVALAKAWSLELTSFDELGSRAVPDVADRSPKAREDLWEFSKKMVEEYLRRPSAALREAAPHHLNLGIRYAWISSELCYVGTDCFDVFSINAYVEKPNRKQIAEITKRSGKPVLIGEFHHGAVDRGLPSTGIRGVATQADRGRAYRYYVEQGAAIPSLIGVHHFQWNDQPVLGRFDGENYNIGLVDVCNRPYAELIEAIKATNARIFDVASGRVAPTSQKATTIPAVYF